MNQGLADGTHGANRSGGRSFLFLPIVGALVYRARPDPIDVEPRWFDAWGIAQFAPGKRLGWTHEAFTSVDEAKGVNRFLEQDFGAAMSVQEGIRSRGFKGSAYNPFQEGELIQFEKMLDAYLDS